MNKIVVVVVDVNKIQCLCFVFPLVSGFERQGEDEHHKEVALPSDIMSFGKFCIILYVPT